MISLNDTLKDGVHHYGLRVYYEDTDAIGIVYYANYLKFAERARTELIRLLGFATISRDNDTAFAVTRCAVDYLLPARLDDQLDVETSVTAVGGARIELEQTVVRAGVRLVRLAVVLAMVTPSGKPTRMPQEFRAALEPLLQT